MSSEPPVYDFSQFDDDRTAWREKNNARRDRYATAIWERQNPGRRYVDCEHPWQADAEEDAVAVMAVADEEIAAAVKEALRAATARLYAEFPADPEIGRVIDPG